MRVRTALAVSLVVSTSLPVTWLAASPATATTAGRVTFTMASGTAAERFTWTVPDGVTLIHAALSGASGADGAGPYAGSGGRGATVRAGLNVAPGDVVSIGLGANGSGTVGGASGPSGFRADGYYGGGGAGGNGILTTAPGGGGGGASVLEVTRGAASSLALLAGGGGGGGGAVPSGEPPSSAINAEGGDGGNAASGSGAWGPTPTSGGNAMHDSTTVGYGGGAGGGSAGGAGGEPGSAPTGGAAGSGFSGGAGGTGTLSAGGGGGGSGAYAGGGGGASAQFIPPDETFAGAGGGAGFSGLFTGTGALEPLWTSANAMSSELAGTQGDAAIEYIAFISSTLPSGRVNEAYSTTLEAVYGAGDAPSSWSVSPALPSGLSLDSTTGVISGTPSSASTGTYTVTATRETLLGKLLARTSKAFSLTVTDVPGAPGSVVATAGAQEATVQWSAPASDGGSTVTGYTVTANPGSRTCSSGASPCTVTGLTAGTSYTFTVTATNAVGEGPASSASNAVTPTASGGGGSGGGDASSAATSSAAPSAAPAATPTPVASTAPTARPLLAPAVIPGLRLPTRIKAPGTTVIVPRTLRTAEGQRVRARAVVTILRGRTLPASGGPSTQPAGARVVYGPKGRVSIVNSGRHAITVRLRLTAPGTAGTLPLDVVHRWSVMRAAR